MEDVLAKKKDVDMTALITEFYSVIPGIEKASSVPVLYADTLKEKEFIEEWVMKNRACIIKGAVKHWPAIDKWKDKDYWTSKCENFEVQAYPHFNHNLLAKQQLIGDKNMSFYDAIERLFAEEDDIFSMPGERISENNRFSKIIEDLKDFKFLSSAEMPRAYARRRMFLYRRAATAWHYHGTDETLMCQIKGTKRVGLLPPEIPQAKYVTKFLHDELHLDGEKLNPNLDLKPMMVDVEEGDALYIPPYWHHGVIPADDKFGFTLAYCWKSPWHKLGNFSNYFVRSVFKQAMWPFNKFTLFLPLIAFYAWLSHSFRRIKGIS